MDFLFYCADNYYMQTKYVNLSMLAQNLGLPANYLKQLALNHRIPYLNVSSKLRFDREAVENALEKLTIRSQQNHMNNQPKPARVAAEVV
jgi:hypothetical protein